MYHQKGKPENQVADGVRMNKKPKKSLKKPTTEMAQMETILAGVKSAGAEKGKLNGKTPGRVRRAKKGNKNYRVDL